MITLTNLKLVFFFDEAYLLFEEALMALVNMIEQVASLIRSKGVGDYFITQNPTDVPDDILGQLGNFLHVLRAFEAKDCKELRFADETYRENPRSTPKRPFAKLALVRP